MPCLFLKKTVDAIQTGPHQQVTALVACDTAGNVSGIVSAPLSLFRGQIARTAAGQLNDKGLLGKASILIPSPNVAENHQYHNAMALVNRGAAEIIEEKDLTGEKLLEKVKMMFGENGKAEKLGIEAKKMSVPDASDKIYEVIISAANKGKKKK